jgi:hypothetical protein
MQQQLNFFPIMRTQTVHFLSFTSSFPNALLCHQPVTTRTTGTAENFHSNKTNFFAVIDMVAHWG